MEPCIILLAHTVDGAALSEQKEKKKEKLGERESRLDS